MTTQEADPNFWWERIPKGKRIPLGFVKIDRKGSTSEWEELPEEEVHRRRARYREGVEAVASACHAVQPLNWQGDGVMLFLTDSDKPAPVQAFHAARLLWERVRIDLNLSARIAVHAAQVNWDPDPGKLDHREIDLCGHLEQVAPENSIALTEDVYLNLPEQERKDLGRLGMTSRDGIPAYVFPPAVSSRKSREAFSENSSLVLWDSFRKYLGSSEIRKLRYVGFRLAKREPPALDISDVFIPPEVETRSRFLSPGILARKVENVGKHRDQNAVERESTPWDRAGFETEQSASRPFKEILRENRSVIVLGDPGSGKTTLLRWLAVESAKGRYAFERTFGICERLLALPVSVGRLAEVWRLMGSTVSVPEALTRYFADRSVADKNELLDFLQKELDTGSCLVLLDGLDEVIASEREAIRAWLEVFAANFQKNRFIVTSRVVGYSLFLLPGGIEVTLLPFEQDQIAQYLKAFNLAYRRWETGEEDPIGAREATEAMLEAMRGNPRLGALARNPFLLSALALIHRAEGRLPRHRVQAYEIFARALCETWAEVRRLVPPAERRTFIAYEEEALPILGELAIRMHDQYPAAVAPEKFVIDTLSQALSRRKGLGTDEVRKIASDFLKKAGSEIQILHERGAGSWGFLHLTFQEFFVAAGLHALERFEEVAWNHLFDPRWEEVIRLGVGYLALVQKRPEAARKFIEKVFRMDEVEKPHWTVTVLRKHIPLAALLAAEAGDALPETMQAQIAQRFAEWIVAMPAPSDRILSEISLGEFRHQVAKMLIPGLRRKEAFVRVSVAYGLGNLKSEVALGPLLEALKDEEASVRWSAAYALGNLKSEAALGPLLEVLKDQESSVRESAAEALGKLKSEAALGPLLEALKDEESSVRSSAADALGWLKLEATLGPLLEALKDEEATVRMSAALALGNLKSEAALGPLLEALKNQESSVRGSAALTLGILKLEAALGPLLEVLKADEAFVRWCAAYVLGSFKSEAALGPLLEALKDPASVVRLSAALALGTLKSEAALGPLLELLKDEEVDVRVSAAHALGNFKSEAALGPLLEALGDNVASVRMSAADALGDIGTKQIVPGLIQVANNPAGAGEVKTAALRALWQISNRLPLNTNPNLST